MRFASFERTNLLSFEAEKFENVIVIFYTIGYCYKMYVYI
jgi:hypothetical protein